MPKMKPAHYNWLPAARARATCCWSSCSCSCYFTNHNNTQWQQQALLLLGSFLWGLKVPGSETSSSILLDVGRVQGLGLNARTYQTPWLLLCGEGQHIVFRLFLGLLGFWDSDSRCRVWHLDKTTVLSRYAHQGKPAVLKVLL